METIETILHFWFGTESDDARVASAQARLWWMKHPDVDREIRERFEGTLEAAMRGELDGWRASPRGRLALIVLADQFPRNMYRDTPRAFAYDAQARGWCLEALDAGADQALRPIERVFLYLPLEHSERLEDQERAVALFKRLHEEAGEAARPAFAEFLDYAYRHRDVIARFGRFPHRNRILQRASTDEEEAFLRTPGSSF
ncbi:MAG TPA: DUF924 family protein [Noviherbaspirillum sp.]|nr:DUF924 family protein [Noviherbaspirillum sp.]